jgi:hypothetical protein
MNVVVNETGKHKAALQIEGARAAIADEAADFGGGADGDDAVAAEGDGFGERLRFFAGPNFGVQKDEIGGVWRLLRAEKRKTKRRDAEGAEKHGEFAGHKGTSELWEEFYQKARGMGKQDSRLKLRRKTKSCKEVASAHPSQ